MPTINVASTDIEVDEEGFMADPSLWLREMGEVFAGQIGIEMSDGHWDVVNFVREDYAAQGETPTLRRVSTAGGFPTKSLFKLFPKKPAKKMAYIAGVPKPHGCV